MPFVSSESRCGFLIRQVAEDIFSASARAIESLTAKTEHGEGDGGNLIERLLAGPDDAELTPRELALLDAHLVNHPPMIEAVDWFGGNTTKQEENYRKLATIRDSNRNLQAAVVGPAPVGVSQTEQGEGNGGTGSTPSSRQPTPTSSERKSWRDCNRRTEKPILPISMPRG